MTRRGDAKKIVIADIDPTVTFWPGVEIDRHVILATRKKIWPLATPHAQISTMITSSAPRKACDK